MPTTYAHYRFGETVYGLLPQDIQGIIAKYRQLYDFGVHGPDLLFYYRPVCKNRVNRIGYACHEQTGRVFFSRALRAVKAAGNPEAALSYLTGVVCHFSLDRECHPYVGEKEKTGVSHSAIEASFDRYLMDMDGLDPLHHKVTGHLHPTPESARVISEFYPGTSTTDILACQRYMVFCLDLLALPPGARRTALKRGLTLTGMGSTKDMLITEVPNLQCEDSDRLLLSHYADALRLAPELIRQLIACYHSGAPLGTGYDHTFGVD